MARVKDCLNLQELLWSVLPYKSEIISHEMFSRFLAYVFITYLCVSSTGKLVAQTLVSSFSTKSEICREEFLVLQNESVNSQDYSWDFCVEDIASGALSSSKNIGGSIYSHNMVMLDSLGYLFTVAVGGNITRHLYSDGQISGSGVLLQELSASLTTPKTIHIYRDRDVWVGFISDWGASEVLRVNFGSDLSNTSPSIEVLSELTDLNSPEEAEVIGDSISGYQLLILDGESSPKLHRVDLGTSLTGAYSEIDHLSLTGIDRVRGFSILATCSGYHGLISSFGTNAIHEFEIAGSSTGMMSLGDVYTRISNPNNLSLFEEAGIYYGIVQQRSGTMKLITYDNGLATLASVSDYINNVDLESNGFTMFQDGGEWVGYSAQNNGSRVYRLDFPGECSSNVYTSEDFEPREVIYSDEGTYKLSLAAIDEECNRHVVSQEVEVSMDIAPDLSLVVDENRCIENENIFQAISSIPEMNYEWDFGDGTVSNGSTISHQYDSPGSYLIELTGTPSEGSCSNTVLYNLTIYPAPNEPDFLLPDGIPCTEGELIFQNLTDLSGIEDIVSYEWDFNGESQSSEKDGRYAFSTTGMKEINLKMMIPGCTTSVVSKSLDVAYEGPVIAFDYTNNCQGEDLVFTSEVLSQGGSPIDSYSWDFGDGSTGAGSEVTHSYNTAGNYLVSLLVTTEEGCDLVIEKNILIDFSEPFSVTYSDSVTNVPIEFSAIDKTISDDIISSYSWDFGELGDFHNAKAIVRFPNTGRYGYNLEVMTEQGCTYSNSDSIDILEPIYPFPFFKVRSPACQEEFLVLQNESVNSQDYSWDFCVEDIASGALSSSKNIGGSIYSHNMVMLDSLGYLFTVAVGGNITRHLYSDGQISGSGVLLQELSASLTTPKTIHIYRDRDVWVGFISDWGASEVLRVNFGSDLSNTSPSIEVLSELTDLNSPEEAEVIGDSISGYQLLILDGESSPKLHRVDLGTSLTGAYSEIDHLSLTGIDRVRGFSILATCSGYHGLISSFGTNAIHEFEIAGSSTGMMSLGDVYTRISNPNNLSLFEEAGIYYGIVQQRSGAMKLLTYNYGFDSTAAVDNYLNLGTNCNGFTIFQDQGEWVGYSAQNNGSSVYRLDFPGSCNASIYSSTEVEPRNISYSEAGKYKVSLTANDSDCDRKVYAFDLEITSETAPPISFLTTNIDCATSTATFQADTTLGDFESLQWDFGDGATATGYEVSHQFGAAGFFDVSVTGSNTGACSNTELREINIFATPVNPDFRVETEQFCTGSQVTMVNLSDESGYDGELIDYLWQIGDESYTDREPLITFDTPGTYNASLIVNIPGCESEPIDTTFTIESSTAAAFDYETDCEGNPVIFENLAEDTGTQSYLWDFGDGFQSTEFAPNYTYASSGLYQVTQQVIADNGCVRTETEQVEVLDIPTINFQNTTGCAGNLLELTDESVVDRADIVQRYWYLDEAMNPFDSGISASFTPEQGTYEVTLSVLATNGCSSEGFRSIHVDESPEAALDIANTCNGEIWTFTDESPNPSRLIDRAWYINGIVQENTSKEFIHLFDSPGTYTVALEVTGVNFCPTTVISEVEVLGLPDVRIQSSDGCAGDDIVLTDSLVNINDAIVSRTWFVDGQRIGNGPQAVMENYDVGSYEVNVQMMSAKGCTYEATRIIRVQPVPEAEFTLNEDFGIHPFTLNSTYPGDLSNEIAWYLDGELVDTTASLNYTFDAPGAYQLDLVVRTDQGCRDSASTTIRSIIPEIDLDLRSILVEEVEEDIRFSAIIQNRSNLPLDNFRLKVQFEDQFPIYQDINRRINDGSTIREDLDFNLSTLMNIDYICFSLVSTDFDEEDLRNNEFCLSFRENAQLIEAYPNPTDRYYTFKVVSPSSGEITVTLVDLVGRVQKIFRDNAVLGLNQYELDLVGIEAGVYSLIIQTQTGTLKTRIVKQ